MSQYIDICLNLMNRQFKNEEKEVVERAKEAGIEKMIITGTSLSASVRAEAFIQDYPGVLYSTAGIHPHDAKTFQPNDIATLNELLSNPHVVAVGECGLDFDRMNSTKEEQETCFIAQLDLARKTGKPLFLHERAAHDRFLDIMSDYPDLIQRSIVHCFTSGKEELMNYLNRGFYIGITGWICDKSRGKTLQEAVQQLPLDRVMIETDGPYLVPKNMKPRPNPWRNESQYLPHIAKTLAAYMEVSEETLKQATTENAKRFFNL